MPYFLKGFFSFIEGISILFSYSNSFVFQNPQVLYDVELLRTASLSLYMWLYRASWLYRATEICLGIALPSAFVPCLTATSHMDNHVQSTPRPVPSSDYSSLFWFSSTACTALSRNSVCVISGHKIFFLIPSSPPGWKCTKQCEHLQDLCVTFHPGLLDTATACSSSGTCPNKPCVMVDETESNSLFPTNCDPQRDPISFQMVQLLLTRPWLSSWLAVILKEGKHQSVVVCLE